MTQAQFDAIASRLAAVSRILATKRASQNAALEQAADYVHEARQYLNAVDITA